MKINSLILLFAVTLVMSCKESKKNAETVPETAIESSELENYSEKFKRLMVTQDGVLRGFTFITDSSEVRRNENAELLASDAEKLQYTVQFNEFELADIVYHLKGNEIDTFEVDLYLKDKQSTDSLVIDFKKFYNKKYGSLAAESDSLVEWNDSVNNVGVKLKIINKDIDHGLGLFLYKTRESRGVVQ